MINWICNASFIQWDHNTSHWDGERAMWGWGCPRSVARSISHCQTSISRRTSLWLSHHSGFHVTLCVGKILIEFITGGITAGPVPNVLLLLYKNKKQNSYLLLVLCWLTFGAEFPQKTVSADFPFQRKVKKHVLSGLFVVVIERQTQINWRPHINTTLYWLPFIRGSENVLKPSRLFFIWP